EPGSMVMVTPVVTTGTTGTFLYAADKKLNRVLQYSTSPVTGALTALSPPAVSTGLTPVWVGASHDGQYVLTANNGSQSVSIYVIHDPQSGILGNAPVAATGTNPSAVLVK
ncbi:MAG TPA: beta-propeller fold lactonase family protein, partial [Terriglobales bacterium]|nr:beta-propeller fold lactonase family protein [Terriglobales bacterium]